MPQTPPGRPKTPTVIGSGKDPEKGFYRDLRMPNGIVRREWTPFSEETKKQHKRKQDEFNDKVGWASKPSLTNIGGAMMATGAAMGAGAVLLAKKTPNIAKDLAAKQKEKNRINPVVKRAGRITSKLNGRNQRIPGTTRGQIDYYREMSGNQTGQRGASFAGREGARPAPNRQMSLTREQYNARLNPKLGGQSSSLYSGQSSPSLRGQATSFTPSTAAQREEAIQAMQIRKHGSPLQGQSTNLTAVREEAIQAMQQRKYGSPLQGQTSPLPARGSTMPETGNLFDQPEAPKKRTTGGSKGGTKGGTPRTTPLTRGGAAPRVPVTPRVAVTALPRDVSVKGKSPAEIKAIEDAMRARRASGGTPPKPNTMPSQFNQMPKAGGGPTAPGRTNVQGAINQSRMPSQFSQMPKSGGGPTAPGRTNVQGAVQASGTRAPGVRVSIKPKNPLVAAAEQRVVEDAVNQRRAVRAGTRAPGARFRPGPTPDSPGAMRAESAATAGRPRATFRPVGSGPKPAPMPAQFSQMPKAGGGPTANVPSRLTQSIPKVTPKPGFLGKVGGMLKGSGPLMAVGHLLEDAYSGVQSAAKGDWKSAGQRATDLLGHTPTGAANYVANDLMTLAQGKKITRGVPSSIGDRIVHGKIFPNKYYSDSAENRPAAAPKTTAPAASGGNKPAGGQKPYEPRYFPEAGGNGNAVRKPDSYLGEAFDYSLQKGTTSGTKYLEHMFRRDKVSEDDQQRLRERFNKKVVGDQTLSEYGAKQGITKTLEGKKSGLGEALLGKYRDTGTYKGNTDYDVMRAAAEARMARK